LNNRTIFFNKPMTQKLFYTVTLICCCALGAVAQSNKPAVKKPAAAKTPAAVAQKPLRFRTTWGVFLSDTLPRPEVLKLLDSALIVRDGSNQKFPVVSFDFTWEKKEPYLNDTTNEAGFYTEYIGDSFKSNKIDTTWSNRLKETIQKGEVLFFNNIVIKYTGDKFYRAPELKITIK
jgi:hypothetical protein